MIEYNIVLGETCLETVISDCCPLPFSHTLSSTGCIYWIPVVIVGLPDMLAIPALQEPKVQSPKSYCEKAKDKFR